METAHCVIQAHLQPPLRPLACSPWRWRPSMYTFTLQCTALMSSEPLSKIYETIRQRLADGSWDRRLLLTRIVSLLSNLPHVWLIPFNTETVLMPEPKLRSRRLESWMMMLPHDLPTNKHPASRSFTYQSYNSIWILIFQPKSFHLASLFLNKPLLL